MKLPVVINGYDFVYSWDAEVPQPPNIEKLVDLFLFTLNGLSGSNVPSWDMPTPCDECVFEIPRNC